MQICEEDAGECGKYETKTGKNAKMESSKFVQTTEKSATTGINIE